MRRIPVSALCLAAFPVLFLYAHNAAQVQLRTILLPLAVSVAAAMVVFAIAAIVLRNAELAALLTSAWLFLFYSYGHVYRFASGFHIAGVVMGRSKLLLPLWLLGILVTGFLAFRYRKARMPNAVRVVNTFAVAAVAIQVAQAALFHVSLDSRAVAPAAATPSGAPAGGARAPAAPPRPGGVSLPDIYYIIPDSYASSSVLQRTFDHDNSAFTEYLQSRGFYVASRSVANYAFTAVSLASSLNMKFLQDLGIGLGRDSPNRAPLDRLAADNAVIARLKESGYTIINAGSWWAPTMRNPNADVNLAASPLDEFMISLLETTVLYSFVQQLKDADLREKTLFTFRSLAEIPLIEGPTFTLAHIICPHPPFLFGPHGEELSLLQRVATRLNPGDAYVNQVRFVNSKLRETVDVLLARSSSPPIIIIQGDHGAAYVREPVGSGDFVPSDEYLQAQMGILNAYYLPGVDASAVLYDSISPVNTFRVIFNTYFDQDLPLLPDRSFFSTHQRPYAFTDVTDQTKHED